MASMVKIFDYVLVSPVGTNCYIFGDRLNAVMVDPGGKEAISKIEELKAKGIIIKHLLITHGHFDHASWYSMARQITGATVYLHRSEEESYLAYHDWVKRYGIIPPKLDEPDVWIEGEPVLDLGGYKIKVYHTPGHTPGHVIYAINDFELQDGKVPVAFVGDLIFKSSIGRTDFPFCDSTKMVKSLKFVMNTLSDETIIFSGHGESTILGIEKENNPYLIGINKGISIF
ncbi:MAG: MBL fold metallo-hydrolase [Candidatus Heimdallarchaeota archaeon]|nr:MBL fold metallo-hydrolase [Candidatus Heimdallarchaeota archaeon]